MKKFLVSIFLTQKYVRYSIYANGQKVPAPFAPDIFTYFCIFYITKCHEFYKYAIKMSIKGMYYLFVKKS